MPQVKYDRLASGYATELVRLKLDLEIVTGGTVPSTRAAKEVTRQHSRLSCTNDPRSGGELGLSQAWQATGLETSRALSTLSSRTERQTTRDYLQEVIPTITRIAVLCNIE